MANCRLTGLASMAATGLKCAGSGHSRWRKAGEGWEKTSADGRSGAEMSASWGSLGAAPLPAAHGPGGACTRLQPLRPTCRRGLRAGPSPRGAGALPGGPRHPLHVPLLVVLLQQALGGSRVLGGGSGATIGRKGNYLNEECPHPAKRALPFLQHFVLSILLFHHLIIASRCFILILVLGSLSLILEPLGVLDPLHVLLVVPLVQGLHLGYPVSSGLHLVLLGLDSSLERNEGVAVHN